MIDLDINLVAVDYVAIKKSPPFAYSEKGKLCHRPRYAGLHYRINPAKPHLAIDFLCSSGACGKNARFSYDTNGRLMCKGCEKKAAELGMPTASQIVGRHICTGKLKVKKSCECTKKCNN